MTSLSELSPPGGGQNKTEFTASGAIAAGKPVILNSTGTVTEISGSSTALDSSYGDVSIIQEATHGVEYSISCDPFNTGRFIVGYTYSPQSAEKPMCRVGTTSGDTITWGTAVVLNSGSAGGNYPIAQFDPTYENRVLMSFYGGSSMGYSGFTALTLGSSGGTTVTVHASGAAQYYASTGGKMTNAEMAFDHTKVGYFLAQYHDSANNGYYRGGSIATDGTISLGAQIATYARWDKLGTATRSNKSGKIILAGARANAAPYASVAIATVNSDRSVTIGSFNTFYSANNGDGVIGADWDPNDDTKIVVGAVYTGSAYPSKVLVGTVSGTTITWGTPTTIFDEDWASGGGHIRFNPNPTTAGEFAVVFTESGLSPNLQLRVSRCSYTGTTITKHANYNITTEYMRVSQSAEFDISSGVIYMATAYDNAAAPTNPNYGRVWMFKMANKPTNLTATNLMGVATDAIADGEVGLINTWGGVNNTQSGMTIGSDYYAQHTGAITTTDSDNSTLQQLLGGAISATKLNIKDYTG